MKLTIILLLVTLSFAKYMRQNHDYWYTASKSSASSGIPFVDYSWNYCDKKCLYLQNYVEKTATTQFVVLQFKASSLKADFAACYAKNKVTGEYQVWNKVVQNAWFEKHCGADTEDWTVKNQYFVQVPKSEIQKY